MPFREVQPPKIFVGRHQHIQVLDKLYADRSFPRRPIIISGPAGIGKTALVAHFLATRVRGEGSLWWDLTAEPSIDDAIMELDRRIRSERGERSFVVVDGADKHSERDLEVLFHRIVNYKLVRGVYFTTRKEPELGESGSLGLKGFSAEETAELFRQLSGITSPRPLMAQIVATTKGVPATIEVLAGVARTSGMKELGRVLNGQLYDVSETLTPGKLITVGKPQLIVANSDLLERLKRQPKNIYDLSPRKFEEVLAELLNDMGMEVELTQATRDGGRDILAYLNSPVGKLLCLVEAKRYREDRTVGVGLVRQLHGTLCDHMATSAMMVTTSKYSPDAHAYRERHKFQLSLRDYADVVAWIQTYKQGRAHFPRPEGA